MQLFNGSVKDSLSVPLGNANILAEPISESASFQYAITDSNGKFKLKLEKNETYMVIVSFLGYHSQKIKVTTNQSTIDLDFILKSNNTELSTVTITDNYKPIIVKKDSIIFDVASFTKGNERKMKEVLEKLPGVEVSKNGTVTVHGKRVTQMMVEGKAFFGGGSKLAVENIPADALDKIEVIDNFNEIDFLKDVTETSDLAMNVRLKEGKKNFVFGDMKISGGSQKHYQLHPALFYYSPKYNISYIGDLNNIGESVMSYEDLLRLQGGISKFLNAPIKLSDLRPYTEENKDVVKNKSQFSAFNYGIEASDKIYISGFGLFSKPFTQSITTTTIDYLTNENTIEERKKSDYSKQHAMSMFTIKLDYSKTKSDKWYYNAEVKTNDNKINDLLNTSTSSRNINFNSLEKVTDLSFKHFIEWHKSYNKTHKSTFVVNHSFDKNNTRDKWLADVPFLDGLVPITSNDLQILSQLERVKNNQVDALFKHYWVLNNVSHIYTSIGNNFIQTNLTASAHQEGEQESAYNQEIEGFENHMNYKLNDAFLNIDYKFMLGKWTNMISTSLHFYSMRTKQILSDVSLSRVLLEPALESKYKFNNNEELKLNYTFKNKLPLVNQLNDSPTLMSYNTIYKGNAFLKNEHYHSARLFYKRVNIHSGFYIFSYLMLNKKERAIRNEMVYEDTERFLSPILSQTPETTWNFMGNISKKIYRFNLGLDTQLNWFDYHQVVDGISSHNKRSSQNVGIHFKTDYKAWPIISIGYEKGFSQFSGLTESKFQTDSYELSVDYSFLSSLTFKADYNYFTTKSISQNENNAYDIANLSLNYQCKNSPWDFTFTINNLLNSKTKTNINISDILISERSIFILPRVFLLTVNYKL